MYTQLPMMVNQAIQAFQQGQHGRAEELLQKVLGFQPRNFDALHTLGVMRAMQGRRAEAIELFKKALSISKQNNFLHFNLAKALSDSDLDADAIVHHKKATELAPRHAEAFLNFGKSLFKLDRYEEALGCFEKALAIQPNYAEALVNQGSALSKLDREEEALRLFDKALTLAPQLAEGWTNKGNVLHALRRYAEAIEHFDRALQINPKHAEAWLGKGLSLHKLRQHDEALRHYDHALTLKPDYAEAWLIKGVTLVALKRQDEAFANIDRALSLRLDYAQAWTELGNAFVLLARYQEALESFDRATNIQPGHAEAWDMKGTVQGLLKQSQAALDSYQKAFALNPRHKFLAGRRMLSKMQLCDWQDLEGDFAFITGRLGDRTPCSHPLSLFSFTDRCAELQKVARMYAAYMHPDSSSQSHLFRRTSGDKICLGYFSADFHAHPVSQLLVELLEQHDRSCFELIGFSFGPETDDPLRQRIARSFDRFIDVRTQSDEQVAQLSRELGIDIAINLGGHTHGARTDIFALRAAPIQVNYLGYPGTMGAEYMDYLLADKVVCPPESQPCYTEKLAWLPHCFLPHDSTQEISSRVFTRQEFGLPETGLVFCCFNNHYKLNPGTFDVWMRLLDRVPGSVLWLSDGQQVIKDNLAREASARGVDPTRIVYAPRLENMAEHLARYRLADLFIDTLPYNAHTTACDALWAGVPVLTCTGQSFASRVAASLLHAIDLPELVTDSLADYETLALELATNPARLTAIRQKLATNRLSAPLFDTRRMARGIEQVYTAMYARYRDGMPPSPIDLKPL